MSEEFKIEIISPDKSIYSGETKEAILPCFEGQVTILKDHIPLITFLRPGLIEIDKNEKFYVEDGTVEFSKNNLLILSATALSLKNINSDLVESMRRDAEKKLSANQISDKQKYILNHKVEILKQIN
tara:strand:- start:608 stop:988 length:381 start_codon:yes stop_codon:yes gene_type:complete